MLFKSASSKQTVDRQNPAQIDTTHICTNDYVS